jgi:hypothetical protein
MFNQKPKKKEEKTEVNAAEEAEAEVAQVPVKQTGVSTDNLKELIEKNIKWSQVIYNQNKQIKHRLTMITVLAWLKVFLIVVPIILGIIYLPPLIKEIWGQYGQMLFGGTAGSVSSVKDLNNILGSLSSEQVKEGLKLLGR